jgi:hypothetical protein
MLVAGVALMATAAACSGDGSAPDDALSAAREIALETTTTSTTSTSTTTTSTTTTTTTEAPPTTPPPTTAAPVRPRTTAPPAPKAESEPPAPRPAPGSPSTIGSCSVFPRSSYWYGDVSTLPVHAKSATYVASVGTGANMHPDFGSGTWEGRPIGIPYTVVPQGQAGVPVSFEYDDESDPGPYPIPAGVPIEGGPQSDGDRHVLVVEDGTCKLYEMFAAYPDGSGWSAGSGAAWDLGSNALRPAGWTSADAAGLPMLPGLVRYDEVASGHIDHAIRITVNRTHNSYVWPARHKAGSSDTNAPPMGTWFRLKADYDISGFPAEAQVILQALKTHGAIVADNGASWFISGAPDERWNNQALLTLRQVKGSAFEAVDTSAMQVSANSGQAR